MRNRWIRWGILALIFFVVTGVAVGHQRVTGSGKPTTIDALCPFGGVESLYSLLTGAGYIDKIRASAVVLLLGTLGLAFAMRRSFCGQICPLGAMQELFGGIGRRLFGRKRPEVPVAIDRPARFLKYVVLIVFGVWTWQAATLVMRPYDPWAAWAHITSAEVLTDFGVGLAVLGVSLVGSVVYERFFCKYLCPMGALLAVFSRFSFLRIAREANACTSCGACDKACPMNIDVSGSETVVSSECISCNECVNACPAAGALEVKSPARGLRVGLATGVVVASFAAIVAVTTWAGTFEWTMPSLAQAVEQSAGSSAGEFDVAAIKGYMSMREVSEATGIPEHAFVERWAVPEADLGKPMKEITEQYGFTPEEVRPWVAEQLAAK